MVSHWRFHALSASPADIERMLRRRELVRVHRGVFVHHTGELSWDQRCWAAALALEPAALCFHSAMPGGIRTGPIHVAVAAQRMPPSRSGVVVHRTADLETRINWNAGPPRMWPAHATLDVAGTAGNEAEMFSALATALQTREVWPSVLRDALAERKRMPQRALLRRLIDDLDSGQHSVLERGYARLERAHGLPVSTRQARATVSTGTLLRDVLYATYGVVVELDGRAFHDTARARDQDARRDLEAASEGLTSIRLTYGQVFRDGCRTAAHVAVLLRRRGWRGERARCENCGHAGV